MLKKLNPLALLLLLALSVFTFSCDDDDDDVMAPDEENEEEVITDVKLTFLPEGGGAAIEALAQDPDGEGPESLAIVSQIVLAANTTYTLNITLENTIEGEDITEEVEEEGAEHMFFFGWTDGLFSDPTGDGNIDNRSDAVNYEDMDENSLPVGLETSWTTADAATGNFRVMLKHQPDIKTATSGSSDGDSDVDLTFTATIQ